MNKWLMAGGGGVGCVALGGAIKKPRTAGLLGLAGVAAIVFMGKPHPLLLMGTGAALGAWGAHEEPTRKASGQRVFAHYTDSLKGPTAINMAYTTQGNMATERRVRV